MNEKKALMIFASLMLAATFGFTLATPAAEEPGERIVGVKVGDWVKYGHFTATYASNDPTAQEPPLDLIDHNNTEWVKNTVEDVSWTGITFETITHYKNDTETTSTSHIDINTGEGNGTFEFISANLSQGEIVYNSTECAGTWINETIQLVYMDALRETNYLEAYSYIELDEEEEQYLDFKIEYFWDKTTGILSERIGTFVKTTEKYTTGYKRSEILTDTNLWQASPDTTPPTAEAGPDQTATVDQIVNFNADSSTDNEGGWGIASYEWDFGDGTQETEIATTHSFKAAGEYIVTLTVKDWAGNIDKDTLTVTVQEASSPPSITGVVILVMLLIVGLIIWKRKAKR